MEKNYALDLFSIFQFHFDKWPFISDVNHIFRLQNHLMKGGATTVVWQNGVEP